MGEERRPNFLEEEIPQAEPERESRRDLDERARRLLERRQAEEDEQQKARGQEPPATDREPGIRQPQPERPEGS